MPAGRIKSPVELPVLVCACIFAAALSPGARADVVVDDFEDVSDWSGLVRDTTVAVEGSSSGLWENHPSQSGVTKTFQAPLDASSEDALSFWMYSDVANGAQIELIFDSENDASSGWDYFRYHIVVDWTGWRHFWVPLDQFSAARNPVGWHRLNYVRLSASGWGHEPLPDTRVNLDDMRFVRALIDGVQESYGYSGSDYIYTYTVSLSEKSGNALAVDINLELPPGAAWQPTVSPAHLDLAPYQSAQVTVELFLPAQEILPERWLETDTARFTIAVAGVERESLPLLAAVPLPERSRPLLMLDSGDFARINDWASAYPWAANAVAGLVARADGWPQSHNDTFGLSQWEPPPEGGQWTLWYVCPEHGVYLKYEGPGRNVCPVDGRNYTGWPYDQVIYSRRHSDNAAAARDLGLAYRITGDDSYAHEAAAILVAYADVYLSYAIHDIHGNPSSSGARAMAQTLDEAIWLIPMAWAYDLIADCPALDQADLRHVENDLLREAVAVIRRNDAGTSNWQSWHNAAVAAVGFALQDNRLAGEAVNGPSGFVFQMQNSVTADGFWYEGSWGYHFFALDPLAQTALMAEKAGLDFFSLQPLHDMFVSAVRFAMPDGTLPPFNDSRRVDIASKKGLYEIGYARYGEQELLLPLQGTTRGREALFWGAELLPEAPPAAGESLVFPDAGYVVLRAGSGLDAHYLALDYGPHGGWHGHYDKLGFISYARGTMMGTDPGTQSYAVPSHTTWDKTTVAHNTVVVDEANQAEATGRLLRSVLLPRIGFARADAGPVYPDRARLVRNVALTADYAIDVFEVSALDGQSHTIDLFYHNPGRLSADIPLSPFSFPPDTQAKDGYKHLANCSSAPADSGFALTFDMEEGEEPAYGSVWANDEAISGSFSISRQNAYSGEASGRLHYDFSAAQGYILYSTEHPPPTQEAPEAVKLAVYGDASGHELRLRVMDATDERFVTTVGPVDWAGWREIQESGVSGWNHYLGNDDGVIDLPVKAVVIDLASSPAAPATGDLYVDDIVLSYPQAGEVMVADFEIPYRALTWQMAPAPGTTLIVGEGLGPDLQVPLPFAMARRQAQDTTFVSLLEPHGAQRTITGFEPLEVAGGSADVAYAFRLTAADWEDFLLAVGEGQEGQVRSASGWSCDGLVCHARHDPAGDPVILAVAGVIAFSRDGRVLLESDSRLEGFEADRAGDLLEAKGQIGNATVRILAPGVSEVTLNGGPVAWTRDGDYVVINPAVEPDGGGEQDGAPWPDGGGEQDEAGWQDGGEDGGIDAGHEETPGEEQPADSTTAEQDLETDGGTPPEAGTITGGCGCGTTPAAAGSYLPAVAVVVAVLRRRKSHTRI